MNRVNRAAARFTLRTGWAGSKGVVSGAAPGRSPASVYRAIILPALSDFAKGAQRSLPAAGRDLSLFPLAAAHAQKNQNRLRLRGVAPGLKPISSSISGTQGSVRPSNTANGLSTNIARAT